MLIKVGREGTDRCRIVAQILLSLSSCEDTEDTLNLTWRLLYATRLLGHICQDREKPGLVPEFASS